VSSLFESTDLPTLRDNPSVRNYKHTLRNIPSERSSPLHRGGSLKSSHGFRQGKQPQANFHVHTVHLDKYQSFFSPTYAQLDSLKNNIKFALKLTLKSSYMFRCEKHHHQGAYHQSLAKVTIVKILTNFNNCNFSKAQMVCSLMMVFFTPKHVGAF